MSSLLFGIHLGNSSGCVGIFKDGKADILASDSGERIIPAVVSHRQNENVVGMAAKTGMARFASSTVTGNKRLMNVSASEKEVADAIDRSSCKVIQDDDGIRYSLEWEGSISYLSPDQIHTLLYKKLHETAASALHTMETILPAVLSVPVHFCSASRREVLKAAEEAGFKVLQLIDEASAALLAHNVGQTDMNFDGYALVYRVGGASLDVSVFWVNSGMYTLVTNVHHHNTSGHLITDALASFLAEEFYQKFKLDPKENRRSMAKLRGAAETCKHVLSTMQSAHCFVESLVDGVDLSSYVSRARFESLLSPLLPKFLDPVSKALDTAGISPNNIQKVVVAGGSLKIPRLQQALAVLFPNAEALGLSPTISPDEVIALGAALQASVLPRGWSGDTIQLCEDVSALADDIILQVEGKKDLEVIARASCPVPLRRLILQTVAEGNDKLSLCILQGSRSLGQACLDNLLPGTSVNVEILAGREGDMHVTLSDQKSERKISVRLDSVLQSQ